MKIVVFNRAFPPEVSATSQLLEELAQGLAENHGCDVSVVAGVPQGTIHGEWKRPRGWQPFCVETKGKVSIFRVNGTCFSKKSFCGRVANYLSYFLNSWVASLWLKRQNVVIAMTDPPIIGCVAWTTAKRFQCRFVMVYNDLFPEAAHLLGEGSSPFIDKYLNRMNRLFLQRADRIVALGSAMRHRLIHEKEADPKKIRVISPWADTSMLVPAPKRNSFSLMHGLADKFVVMHAGNMGLSQNVEFIVQVAARLIDLRDVIFLFIGDGVRKTFLEEEVRRLGLKNVRFLPYQRKDLLSETFASADCFIISLKPGLSGYILPSKLFSILASGRPYVAAVEEMDDVVSITKQYDCGLVSRPTDPADCAQKIRILHHEPALRQRLGTNAREASRSFDRRQAVQAYFTLSSDWMAV